MKKFKVGQKVLVVGDKENKFMLNPRCLKNVGIITNIGYKFTKKFPITVEFLNSSASPVRFNPEELKLLCKMNHLPQ